MLVVLNQSNWLNFNINSRQLNFVVMYANLVILVAPGCVVVHQVYILDT